METDSSVEPLVLIVDDDPDGRELYAVALRDAGFRTEEASDGFEAVDKGYRQRPRVILMDLLMPRLDGWEVVGWLKKNPFTRDIPIVAVTGASDEFRKRALDAGCHSVLPKPCLAATVVEEVRRLVASEE